MASVGNLNATLTLNGKQYELALNRARAGTKTAGRDMSKSFDKAAQAFGTLSRRVLVGASAVAAGLGIATRASLKSAEALDLTSEKLGIATDRLAGVRLAARFTSGMLEGSLDTALQRMVRRVAEAANGTGEAQAAIKELGLDASQLNLLAPDMQLRAIADSMLQVDDQSARVRLAFKLFDAEGVGLVSTLALGSKGLDEFQARAERLGIALTKTDTIAARMATDSMDQLKLAVSGLNNQFAIGLAPTLSLITDDITKLITGFGSVGSEGVGAARVIAFAWSGVLDAFDEIEEVVREVRIGFNQLIVDAAKIAKFTPPAMVTEALGITDIKGQGAAATDTRDRLLADEMADKIAEAFREIDFGSTTTGSTVGGDQFIKDFDALELRIKALAETSANASGRIGSLGLAASGDETAAASKIETLGGSAKSAANALSTLTGKLGFNLDDVRGGSRGGTNIGNQVGRIDRLREQAQRAYDRAARESLAGRTAFEPTERDRRFATATEFVGRAKDLTDQADRLEGGIPGLKGNEDPIKLLETQAFAAAEKLNWMGAVAHGEEKSASTKIAALGKAAFGDADSAGARISALAGQAGATTVALENMANRLNKLFNDKTGGGGDGKGKGEVKDGLPQGPQYFGPNIGPGPDVPPNTIDGKPITHFPEGTINFGDGAPRIDFDDGFHNMNFGGTPNVSGDQSSGLGGLPELPVGLPENSVGIGPNGEGGLPELIIAVRQLVTPLETAAKKLIA